MGSWGGGCVPVSQGAAALGWWQWSPVGVDVAPMSEGDQLRLLVIHAMALASVGGQELIIIQKCYKSGKFYK